MMWVEKNGKLELRDGSGNVVGEVYECYDTSNFRTSCASHRDRLVDRDHHTELLKARVEREHILETCYQVGE